MTAAQGIKLTGFSLRDLLGSSLSSLQDMDGDGISEILVGAPGYSYNKGVMYLLFGRNDNPATIDLDTFTATDGFKIIGNTADGLFGSSVRDIGDINGDGVADFIIGAPGSGATGKAHVVFGVNAWGCNTCNTFKTCQACKAGYDYTWNGVCYKDCPAHAPYKLNMECFAEDPTPPPDPVRGDVTLSDPLPSCKGFVISNSAAGNKQFAYAVDGGGDFNGDGIPDIIISDYQDPSPSTIYLIYGKSVGYTTLDVATMTPTEGFKITGLLIKSDDNSNFITLAGDLDNDGKADLVIGASQADSGAGAVYVIYGGAGYSSFPISSLPSSAAKISGAGGWSVNTRADLNGDATSDLIIGSKTADSSNGAIYVIYGSPTRLSSFNIISTPLTSFVGFKISGFPTASLGVALAGAGDFNGDNIDDLTFAAPGASSGQGVGYVLYGKQTPPFSDFSVTSSGAAGRLTVTGTSSIDQLFQVASDAGDFNQDGVSDVLWASPTTNTNQGTVLLIYGGGSTDFAASSMAPSQGIKLTGVSLRDLLGSSLASLPDINGDGINEVLIGAKGYSYNKGVVYLLFGRNDQPATIDLDTFTLTDGFKILGSTPNGLLGASMRDLGDINNDGVSDVIIGAPGTGSNGKAYVLFGPNAWGCDTCDTSTSTCQVCKPGYDYTWNGLCYKECPLQAPYKLNWECFATDPTAPPDPVRGDITLSDSFDSCQGFSISNSAAGNNQFGYAVSGGGDFNGDKIPDIVISTYEDPNPSTLYVIYGKAGLSGNIDVNAMSTTEGFKITGLQVKNDDNSNFISLEGDIDKDGLADLVIGASLENAAYVIYGGPGYTDFDVSTLPSTAAKISGTGGWNVNTKTDLNGDKINDLIISSKAADSNNGAIYVIYGSQTRLTSFNIASLTSAIGFKISGFSGANLGAAVASAGDFNGDKITDLAFSAPEALSHRGIGYVLYGKKTPPFSDFSVSTSAATGRLTVTGTSSINHLFQAASDAGDFNHDGVSDVLWASPTTNTDQGTVLLIYGGSADFAASSMAASQGIKLTGASLRDLLGSSLASLPDINGDGINEVLIGAKGYSYNKGVLYLLYGRKDKPSTITLDTFTVTDGFKILGSTPGGSLGASIKSIGDINNDGVSDILIGAPGTGSTGRAYVVFGPNGWGCSTCSTPETCQACKPGYEYKADGLCYRKCPVSAPFELNNECFTPDPTPPTYPKPPNVIESTLKNTVQDSAIATYATNKVWNFWSPADALPFLHGQLKTSLTYMRFLNVSRSDRLEEMFQIYADSGMNVIPWIGMPDSIKDSFPQEDLPYMFAKYEVASSFIANFGDDFTGFTLVFVLLVAVQIALTVMKKWMRNLPTVKHLLQKASIFFQNFFIGSFAESLGYIIFYATMEFKHSTKGEKAYSILSPIACYFCIILGVSIMLLNIWIVRKLQVSKDKTSSEEENFELKVLEKKYEGVSVLYEEFSDDSLGQQAAFLFFNIRAIIESFIVGVFFDNPMDQVILLLVLNLIFLGYIAIKKPFDSKLDTVQQFSLLLILFTCNACFVHLARADQDAPENFNSIVQNTSEVAFYLLVVFQFIPLLFFAINMVQNLIETYHFLRTHLFTKKEESSQNTPKRNGKYHRSSFIFPFDHSLIDSSTLQTDSFEVQVSDERLLTSRRPLYAEKSLRIHSRKKRIPPNGGGIWQAKNGTIDLASQPKGQSSHQEMLEKPYPLRRKRTNGELQRPRNDHDSRGENTGSSNVDISLGNLFNPLHMTSLQEEALAEQISKGGLKHKRMQRELLRRRNNSNSRIYSHKISTLDVNLQDPLDYMTVGNEAGINFSQREPPKVDIGQVIQKLKSRKKRKNFTEIIDS